MYGLLGRSLGHSYSPYIHKELGNTNYQLFEVEPERLSSFLEDPNLLGLNVTIPYKVDAMHSCHEISPIAREIGCVNTMVRTGNGTWYGHNTDYDGFLATLDWASIAVKDKVCIILGDGASSKTVHLALSHLGAKDIIHISRHHEPTYDSIQTFYEMAQIIINCTPVGMYPHCPDQSIHLHHFQKLEGVVDLVYNPHRTALLLEAESLGIPSVNGLVFLIAQAMKGSELFLKTSYHKDTLPRIYKKMRHAQENIVLIGMPGVGKSTIGSALAKALGRPFIDTDTLLEEKIGSLSAYIQHYGEGAFRKKECEIILEVGRLTGSIIATGGGCITREENFYPLRQNSRIYELIRPLEELCTEGRILSSGGLERLQELYSVRQPMYAAFRQKDVPISSIDEACATILSDFEESLLG